MDFEGIKKSDYVQGRINDALTVRNLVSHYISLPMEERPPEMKLGGEYPNILGTLFKKVDQVVSEEVDLVLAMTNVGENVVNLERHYLQENTPHPSIPDVPVQTCVLATIRNVLSTVGRDASQIPTESGLISQIDINDINQSGLSMTPSTLPGITVADSYLISILAKEGIEVEPTRNLIDIVDAVKNGKPVVIAQHVLGGDQHSILITGYRYTSDKGFEFRIADPQEASPMYISINDVVYAALDIRFYTSYICKEKSISTKYEIVENSGELGFSPEERKFIIGKRVLEASRSVEQYRKLGAEKRFTHEFWHLAFAELGKDEQSILLSDFRAKMSADVELSEDVGKLCGLLYSEDSYQFHFPTGDADSTLFVQGDTLGIKDDALIGIPNDERQVFGAYLLTEILSLASEGEFVDIDQYYSAVEPQGNPQEHLLWERKRQLGFLARNIISKLDQDVINSKFRSRTKEGIALLHKIADSNLN